jgi:hypothetical protein
MRRVASIVLLVLAGVLLSLTLIANWAWGTVFDSETFSERAVAPLDSESVRRELAKRLTEQLVLAGNQQANSFRPGVEVALEAAIDTDTFRSIFRNAVQRTHESILAGGGGGEGLNLADSFAILTSGLQPTGGQTEVQGKDGLNNSLTDVTEQFDDLGIWELDETIETLAIMFLIGALLAATAAILVAPDRRRAVRGLGVAIVAAGLAIVLLLFVARWLVGRQIGDAELSGAIENALGRVTDDLRTAGIWFAVYGIIVAAAATDTGQRFTPPAVWHAAQGWFRRRRETTWGTVLLAVIGLFLSVIFVQEPLGNLEAVIRLAALWVGYLAVTELLRLVRTVAARADRRHARWPRIAIVGGTLVVILALVTTAFILQSRSARSYAEEAGVQKCNGGKVLCDLTIDQVTFPGSHNSMSSSQYPGFLFAEQIGTIGSQLNAGVRALLIDTHYGVPSTSRVPGSSASLVLTDRAGPAPVTGEGDDPASAERASRLAARAQRAADAQRDIYLCHNHCELGAVLFSSVLGDVSNFLDTNPDEVVMLIIQDDTTPADTAAAIEAAGLGPRVATLEPGAPLPTLRSLIDSGRTLLVFSERETQGAPPWYHSAYEWFQETPYAFTGKDDFNCRPNRGPATAPLFLVNHWVTQSPPNPGVASSVNNPRVLRARIERCIADRGIVPNVVAGDFVERGGLISTVRSINDAALSEAKARRRTKKHPDQGGADRTTRAVIQTGPVAADLAPPPDPTRIETLTGGQPFAFCPTVPPALQAVTAWAEAILGASPAESGLIDLVYGPLLRRDLEPYVDTAANELAAKARPLLGRAEAAVESLRNLGFSEREIKELATSASRALDAASDPDGLSVSLFLANTLKERIDTDRLNEIAIVFASGQPDPATMLDFGYIPPEVAEANGFTCAPIIASI